MIVLRSIVEPEHGSLTGSFISCWVSGSSNSLGILTLVRSKLSIEASVASSSAHVCGPPPPTVTPPTAPKTVPICALPPRPTLPPSPIPPKILPPVAPPPSTMPRSRESKCASVATSIDSVCALAKASSSSCGVKGAPAPCAPSTSMPSSCSSSSYSSSSSSSSCTCMPAGSARPDCGPDICVRPMWIDGIPLPPRGIPPIRWVCVEINSEPSGATVTMSFFDVA
mmetsp:Transcript_15153/g.22125  ORF Transcript_15153/g.22125 Transcript_15153/m.22125 type:complete len:225 (-) Transcript_15153:857-1531(-)